MLRHHTAHNRIGRNMRDVILGGQDGLVNVLGVVLGVAAASQETRLVLAAGLAAAFAESFSMAAVAYTSTIAERDYLKSTLPCKEEQAIERPSSKRRPPSKAPLIVGWRRFWFVDPAFPFIWLPIQPLLSFNYPLLHS